MNIPASTLEQQYASSNPENSAWVSANAGSGKTHVLTQRVIRLMLAGNPPDKILCLTFTKAAAANMKNRVFSTLADWTMMEDAQLDEEIYKASNQRPTPATRNRARILFALALDTPGGLKIQTIHAFCESLLHQFPLEANVPGHFEALQEIEQSNMLAQARTLALSGDESEAAQHYAALIPFATDATIENGLNAIISMRQDFQSWANDGVETALQPLYEKLGVTAGDQVEDIQKRVTSDILSNCKDIAAITAHATSSDKKTDLDLANALQVLVENRQPEVTFELIRKAVLTAKNEHKSEKTIATNFVKNEIPSTVDTLFEIADYILGAIEKINALQLLKNSRHLFTIGDAVLKLYENMKRQRGVIDFDDQIEKCANLLTRAEIKDWIRYRLDRGIDHLLVDEAQDTSPKQWEIINAITEDFHSGDTVANINRTVFVVGDEKQSIFSFQGAEPSEFDKQKKRLQKRVTTADKTFHAGQLELSFRSTQDVLHAVDKVFSHSENLNGLTQSGEQPVHDAVRSNHPGEVQVWPVFVQEKVEQTESWLDPVDKKPADDPAVLLATKIADSIKGWVGQTLPGMEDPLKFGDILVLVRKRDRFLTAFTRTMKDKGLAIAGADRLTLTDHVAVEDLLAIGRVVLLPEDDLSLACVLKGVFFNVDEETLFEFAHSRGEASLYDQIVGISQEKLHPKSKIASVIFERLEKMFEVGRTSSVFDFYANLLGKMEGRKKILSRLGMEAEDVLDSFLDETLVFTNDRAGGLETFITELTKAEPVIKREVELERDEVRVLTVHSSKGLEARVVFLVDHCSAAWSEKHRPEILEIENDQNRNGYLWLTSKEQHVEATRISTTLIAEAAEAEYRRLLYVGMTRAADRLVVCGFRGTREPNHPYWHQMIENSLVDTATEIRNDAGELSALHWISKSQPAISTKSSELELPLTSELSSTPGWLHEPARADAPLPRPLTPSGAFALIDRDSLTNETLKFDANAGTNTIAIQRGNATHKLLEVLPDILPENRLSLATDYLDKTCPNLSLAQRTEILNSIFGILSDDRFKDLFEGETRAEVSLAGRLDVKSGSMLVTGQIDRLVIKDDRVTILDYKTNRNVPKSIAETPDEYITQLALYRDLVARIYKTKETISALLWTQTPDLMVIPDETLDRALDAIKNT